LAVNVVVELATTVTTTAAVPNPLIVVVATGEPVPLPLSYTRNVEEFSPEMFNVGVVVVPGLTGVVLTIMGAVGAKASCKNVNEFEHKLTFPAASLAFAVNVVKELEVTVTAIVTVPPPPTVAVATTGPVQDPFL
jgi:hypothetical protein